MTTTAFQRDRVAVAFCTPVPAKRLPNGNTILEPISVEWHRHRTALSAPTNFNFIELYADRMEVGEARTKVANRVLEHNPVPEYVFFLDYDVLPQHDALTKLLYRAHCFPEYDIYAGVYCCKYMNPSDPLIYAGDGGGAYWDWAVGDLLTTDGHGITSVHMGLTLIRTSLFRKMLDAGVAGEDVPFFKTVSRTTEKVDGSLRSAQGTEDIWFCKLARQVDAKIMVDTSVLAGHIDKNSGITWGLPQDSPPVKRAHWLKADTDEDGEKLLALDVGCGESHRTWDGYVTCRLDIRPEVSPDYCQDTRYLNLPDNHFHLVASSHHLEHIGRWDQERVWQELYRVCKPGGRTEHVVPSIEWAATKIVQREVDGPVLDVLYGAQEAHGYARDFNTHYFGYTGEIGKALAEQAGFVDVTVEDWRDTEALGYNLIIRGRKPKEDEHADSNLADGRDRARGDSQVPGDDHER